MCIRDRENILKTARLLISSGLAQYGYRYVNIDDCWHDVYKRQRPQRIEDRTVSRRSEPSSRAALTGEQPAPWDLLQPQDAPSRHRGAKPRRRYELLGGISLLSPEYQMCIRYRLFNAENSDGGESINYTFNELYEKSLKTVVGKKIGKEASKVTEYEAVSYTHLESD